MSRAFKNSPRSLPPMRRPPPVRPLESRPARSRLVCAFICTLLARVEETTTTTTTSGPRAAEKKQNARLGPFNSPRLLAAGLGHTEHTKRREIIKPLLSERAGRVYSCAPANHLRASLAAGHASWRSRRTARRPALLLLPPPLLLLLLSFFVVFLLGPIGKQLHSAGQSPVFALVIISLARTICGHSARPNNFIAARSLARSLARRRPSCSARSRLQNSLGVGRPAGNLFARLLCKPRKLLSSHFAAA